MTAWSCKASNGAHDNDSEKDGNDPWSQMDHSMLTIMHAKGDVEDDEEPTQRQNCKTCIDIDLVYEHSTRYVLYCKRKSDDYRSLRDKAIYARCINHRDDHDSLIISTMTQGDEWKVAKAGITLTMMMKAKALRQASKEKTSTTKKLVYYKKVTKK